jgi:molybdate transport system regulatory protein
LNTFHGHITGVQTEGSLSLVDARVQDVSFTTIVIETPETAPYLRVGHEIQVMFKETEVSVSKPIKTSSSLQNKLSCRVVNVQKGKLLATVELQHAIGKVYSIITARAVEQLNLQPGDEVLAMIKTNEIMLSAE